MNLIKKHPLLNKYERPEIFVKRDIRSWQSIEAMIYQQNDTRPMQINRYSWKHDDKLICVHVHLKTLLLSHILNTDHTAFASRIHVLQHWQIMTCNEKHNTENITTSAIIQNVDRTLQDNQRNITSGINIMTYWTKLTIMEKCMNYYMSTIQRWSKGILGEKIWENRTIYTTELENLKSHDLSTTWHSSKDQCKTTRHEEQVQRSHRAHLHT